MKIRLYVGTSPQLHNYSILPRVVLQDTAALSKHCGEFNSQSSVPSVYMRIWSVKPVRLWFIIQFIGLNLVISLEAVPGPWWFLLLFYKETKLQASVRQTVVDNFCTPLGTEWQSKRPQFKYLRMVFLVFTSTVTIRCVDADRTHVSFVFVLYVSRGSLVGIAAGWTAGVRFLAGVRDFSFLHMVQTDFEAHKASYPMGAGGSFPWGKATEALSWLLTSI
jgi:hypothetical protein